MKSGGGVIPLLYQGGDSGELEKKDRRVDSILTKKDKRDSVLYITIITLYFNLVHYIAYNVMHYNYICHYQTRLLHF